jgi:hypothetical protein
MIQEEEEEEEDLKKRKEKGTDSRDNYVHGGQ